jgi:hypothetical protein
MNREEFNSEEFDIEGDEIAKMYAIADMKEERKRWANEKAQTFYQDFESLDVEAAIVAVAHLIRNKEITKKHVTELFDNMIEIFEEGEEYEKCLKCNQIKKGVNAKV